MMTPYSRVNSALAWGLGWGIEKESGPRYLWQWGDNEGWKNIVIVHPESRSGLVVFTNGSNGMGRGRACREGCNGPRTCAFSMDLGVCAPLGI
jgi:hypothetical protein